MTGTAQVFVVEDDASLRGAIGELLRSEGLNATLLASAPEFLAQKLPDTPCCLVLDVMLPGVNGLNFQAELGARKVRIPIIFMTGHGDIPMSVKAMKAGAIEFLTKPFRDQDLLDAVRLALERDRTRLEGEKAVAMLREKFETLTPREQEIMACVTAGMFNKQIAAEVGIREGTVKVHRGAVTRKMGARSVAELTRIADILGVRRKALTKLISIVDDDSFRRAMTDLVGYLGYAAASFRSAEEFLESGRLGDTDCLICDVQMPGMDGLELQDRLLAGGSRVPIIFVAADPGSKARGKALAAGALAFLHKPFREEKLISFLDQALARR
jgi:FixJ family two-component response regulator